MTDVCVRAPPCPPTPQVTRLMRMLVQICQTLEKVPEQVVVGRGGRFC